MVQTAEKVRTVVPTEIILADETTVEKHYGSLIQAAKTELAGKVKNLVSTKKQESAANGKLLAFGIAVVGVGIAGLALWQIITGIFALGLLTATAATGTFLKFRYPVWIAKLRANQVVDLARAEYQKQLDLIEAKNAYLNKLREKAANDPIATRQRIADDMGREIDEGDNAAARFEGLLRTQEQNIAQAKKEFPDQNFHEEDAVQTEMNTALNTMRDDVQRARIKLDEYIQRTRLIETRLKLAAGARDMAEFMRDDSAADRIRKIESEVATESAEQEFQEARAALRQSVSAAKRRIQQT